MDSTPRVTKDAKSRILPLLCVFLFAVGFASRTAPLLETRNRLTWQFPTEDGYLMLTIARNIALGKGMSTSDGTIMTNGTQPLATLIYALCFILSRGDKVKGIFAAHLVQTLIAVSCAYIVFRLAKHLLGNSSKSTTIAALSASVWFASPLSVCHTQNCLETGLYALLVLCSVLAYVTNGYAHASRTRYGTFLALGLLLGLTFLSRNDGCLLILTLCLTHCITEGTGHFRMCLSRWIETFLMGTISVIVALPWLMFNAVYFGHIVPISGISEAMNARLFGNIYRVFPSVTEYILMILPIPSKLEGSRSVILVTIFITAGALGIALWAIRNSRGKHWALLSIVLAYGTLLCLFYGVYFGAGYFMSRYLFPLSTFLALAWGICVVAVLERLALIRVISTLGGHIVFAVLVGLLVVTLNARVYVNGSNHMHRQVVEWVSANVPETTWVAAGQSGTLGFFHDRTINLGGKVNPYALRALVLNSTAEYVLSTPVEYIVDWVGVVPWAELPGYKGNFVVLVNAPKTNLGVLKRVNFPRRPVT